MNPKKQEHSTISREPELAVLNTLISATHTWTDTQAVLSIALEQVAKLAESDGAECHLANSAGELQFTAQYNLDPDFVSESLKLRIPSGTGIPGRAYASQSAIHVPDIAAEERYLRREPAHRAGYHSLICIPLTGLDTLLGTFTLYYKQEIQPVTDLQNILTTVGKQMGIAVERARLFQQTAEQVKELQVLQTVSNALNRSANIQEALERSLEAVVTAMNMPCGWVVLLDGFKKIRLAASYNLPSELNPADWAAMQAPCHCLNLLQQGRLDSAINIVECQQLKRVTSPHYPYRSHASIPIRASNLLLGNLNLVPLPDSAFTEENLRMFTAIGDQIGVAVERTRLHEQVKAQRIEEQAALLRLSQALLVESEPQAMMDTAAQITAGSLKVEFAAIALIDEDKQAFSGRAAVGWPLEVLRQAQHIPIAASTGLAYAIRNRALVVIPDESREARFGAPPWVAEMGIVSSLLAPMIVSGEVIGGLVVNSRSPRNWTDDETRLLSLIANEIAQALGRAWQHAHAVERLERISALHDIDVAITSYLDLEDTLKVLLEKVTERLRVDAAAVALIKRDTQELVYAARRGLDGDFFQDGLLRVKEGIAGQVAHSGEPAAIPDVSIEPRFVRRAIAERLGLVSYLAVPLRARGEVIGVLELATRRRRAFLPEEVDFFVTLAGQAAIVIDNVRMFDEALRRAAQQGSLAESAAALLGALDVEALYPTATTAARGTLAAERAAVYLYDPATDRVTCPHSDGLSAEYVAELNHRFRDVPGERLLADPRPVFIADAQTDPATASFREMIIREGFHSYAVFPLTVPGAPLGALVAYRDAVSPFTPDDVTAGQTLAHIVAVALQNARLFEAERAARKRAETLQQVGALLTTHLGLDEVFERLFDLLARVVAYDSVSVQLIDKDGKTYLAAGRGFPDMDQAMRVVRDVHEMAVEKQRRWTEGRPKVIPDTHAESDWIVAPGVEYIRSWVGAPLLVKGDLIGVLNVDSRTVGAYNEAMGETVMAFANQAAIAIENARLFEAERAAHEQAELLRDAAQAVSGTLDLDEVLSQILTQLKRMLPYDTASVLLLGEGDRPALVVGTGYTDEQKTSRSAGNLLMDSRILRQMALDLQPVLIADVRQHPDWIWVSGAEHVRTFLAVPIVTRDQLIGALMIDSVQIGFFNESQVRLTQTLAQHMAVAIKNARLFDAFVNEQQHTALLYHLSLELATNLKPENVANRALQAAADTLGVTRGNILTLEDDDEHLQILAVTGYDRETIEALNQRLNWTISQGVTGRVVRTRMATTVPDVSQDADWIPISGLDDWVRSILSVPLVAGNRVIGTLNLLSEQLGFFKTENLSLITAIASPVALALQNARLYEGLRQRFKELEILADTSSALRKAQSYNDISPILLAKAVEGLKADAGVLLLLENNALIFATIHGETNVKTGDTCPQDAGMMWQALESGKPIFIPDVTQIEELHKSAVCQALMGDALSCACVPLRTTTSAIGVVYLNWKKKSFLSADESRLLESLAEIAANAIHRSALHLQTVQQAQDLTLAYDATIEGWSRALDLRDRETEGHSQRVTNLTLQLAQALRVSESELEHIRRGALLHDIGKMGVPDNILRKAGALSDEEWTMMRRHPQLAYEMLFPIAYLQPALDIPYCHHEKWDGTGYPRGLKGEEIPLTARIFAVVDVFDALTSDRPYRPAWTKRKAIAYIRQQAGIHFDPKVVETFLKMVGKM